MPTNKKINSVEIYKDKDSLINLRAEVKNSSLSITLRSTYLDTDGKKKNKRKIVTPKLFIIDENISQTLKLLLSSKIDSLMPIKRSYAVNWASIANYFTESFSENEINQIAITNFSELFTISGERDTSAFFSSKKILTVSVNDNLTKEEYIHQLSVFIRKELSGCQLVANKFDFNYQINENDFGYQELNKDMLNKSSKVVVTQPKIETLRKKFSNSSILNDLTTDFTYTPSLIKVKFHYKSKEHLLVATRNENKLLINIRNLSYKSEVDKAPSSISTEKRITSEIMDAIRLKILT